MCTEIVTIPCLSDNYAYLVHDKILNHTAVIDVPEAQPVLDELKARDWSLTHILITHHHPDHIDGVDVVRDHTNAKVVGAKADMHRLPALDIAVADGDHLKFGSQKVRVMDVPGHTVGHIAFYFPESGAAFTGDSLMSLGCGRLFEGSPEQMWNSLSKLASLPPQTEIYSGHEYTASNAKFALSIDPENAMLISRTRDVKEARKNNEPTVPSTLELEHATNPFLRAHDPQIRKLLNMENTSDAHVFAEIRSRKDRF